MRTIKYSIDPSIEGMLNAGRNDDKIPFLDLRHDAVLDRPTHRRRSGEQRYAVVVGGQRCRAATVPPVTRVPPPVT
jgi:hypothetical protein